MRARCNAGFTLLELTIVLLLASALAAVATPSFQQLLSRTQFEHQLQTLTSTLHRTALRARQQQTPLQLHISDTQLKLGPETLFQAPDGASLSWRPDQPGSALAFYPTGMNSGGVLALTMDTQAIRLRLHWLTGEVKRYDG